MTAKPSLPDRGLTAEEKQIYDYLRSVPRKTGKPSPAWMPQRRPGARSTTELVQREGLAGLSADVQRLERTRGKTPRSPRRHGRRRGMDRETLFLRELMGLFPEMPRERVLAWARAWSRVPIEVGQLACWVSAFSADGAVGARTWLGHGLDLDRLEILVDDQRARCRIRNGESAESVIARAKECGIDLAAPVR